MHFSQATEYGIIGLIELAKAGKEMPLADIAKKAHVPESFLAKIFQKLQRADVIVSRRGKGGGFSFPTKNLKMHLWRIHEIIEGSTSLQACVGKKEQSCECHRMYQCMLQEVWREAQGALEKTMKKWTIAKLVKKPGAIG